MEPQTHFLKSRFNFNFDHYLCLQNSGVVFQFVSLKMQHHLKSQKQAESQDKDKQKGTNIAVELYEDMYAHYQVSDPVR